MRADPLQIALLVVGMAENGYIHLRFDELQAGMFFKFYAEVAHIIAIADGDREVPSSMLVTLLGMVKVVRPEQPPNLQQLNNH